MNFRKILRIKMTARNKNPQSLMLFWLSFIRVSYTRVKQNILRFEQTDENMHLHI